MKKITLISLLFFICSTFTFSQNLFPFDDNITWISQITVQSGIDGIPSYYYNVVHANGQDTIINDKQYYKLFSDINGTSYLGAVREEGYKVYLFFGWADNEIQLYDFSPDLMVGDTIYSYLETAGGDGVVPLGIYSISNTTNANGDDVLFYGVDYIQGIMETVGGLDGFIPFGIAPDHTAQLLCTFSDSTNYYGDEESCLATFYSSVHLIHSFEEKIKLSPNPTSGIIYIDTEELCEEVAIYDISGKQLSAFPFQKEINLSEFQNGMYFIKVKTADKIYSDKVIISR